MRIDLGETVRGLRAAWYEFGEALAALVRDMEPWVMVLVGLFCGAWVVQVLERLTQVPGFAWLRWLRWLWWFGRYARCVFPGCTARIPVRYCLCRNHFLAAARYGWEHQDGWGVKDATAPAFYVYLLELDGGRTLYAGQTRNLMRRVHEHGNGTTKTTAGRRPLLVWFEQVATRQAAVEKEADLKHRIDTQPAQVRRMVNEFRRR
jgi:predicted GIY-YIG superfamily endonuclease